MANLKPLISVYRLAFAVLSISFLSSSVSWANGECWYLQMPKKNAEYLIKQCSKEDQTRYDKALASLPQFIKKRTVKELEICVRAEGQNEQEISGKKHPRTEINIGNNTVHYNGGYYISNQSVTRDGESLGWGQFNLNKRMTAKEMPLFKIKTSRKISKKWCPTFVKYEGKKAYLLLERELNSNLERPAIKSHLKMTLSNPKLEEITLVWLINDTDIPEGFNVEYIDTVSLIKAKGEYDETTGLEIGISRFRGKANLNVDITHDVKEGNDEYSHRLKLDELPKQEVEFEYHSYAKNKSDEGKQGSLEIKLIPVTNK